MTARLAEVQSFVADRMDEITAQFKPAVKITVAVRIPGNDDADFLMTNDTIDDVVALLQRRKAARNG